MRLLLTTVAWAAGVSAYLFLIAVAVSFEHWLFHVYAKPLFLF
jgi:hypothetical protein